MTGEFKLLLQLYACAARGERYTGTVSPAQRAGVISLAALGGCTGMIMLALSEYGAACGCRDEAADRCVKTLLLDSVSKRQHIMLMLSELEKEGVGTLLLKGFEVSRLYSVPECRVSSDTDILIDEKDEKKAYRLMRSLGYTVVPRTVYSHHATATLPSAGVVELHTSLFFEMLNDILFDGCYTDGLIRKEPTLKVECDGGVYNTLGYTDHLIFLTFHMIQHFIRSGTSVRQIYDVMIYTATHRDKIDTDRYLGIVQKSGYMGFLSTVYTFGVRYLGFCPDELPVYNEADEQTLCRFADDLEKGGWIGKNRYDGEELFRYYGSQKAENKDKYKKYIRAKQREKMMTSIFPDRERIEQHFPFASNTLLLPLGWVCWLFYGAKLYLKGELSSDVGGDGLQQWQKERLKLFSDMGL